MAALRQPYHLVARDGSVLPYSSLTGSLLGIPIDPLEFGMVEFILDPDDRLVIMSDGLTEAGALKTPRNRSSTFDPARLLRTLVFLPDHAPLADQVARLFGAAQTFVGTGWPDDDTTALLLARRPAEEPASPLSEGAEASPEQRPTASPSFTILGGREKTRENGVDPPLLPSDAPPTDAEG